MAGKFKKSILKVGVKHSPDGELPVTSERLAHWASQHKRLTDNGQVIPMHWDHGTDLEMLSPISLSDFKSRKTRSAANTVGRMVDFKIDPSGDEAEILFSVSDESAAAKVDSNDVYVSPVVMKSFKDGSGNEYDDVITHLDIVNHPVDHGQGPAVRVDDQPVIACALRLGTESKPYLPEDDKSTGNSTEEPSEETETEELPEEELPESSNDATIGDLILPLQDRGINLPDDTTPANFLDRLKTALIAANAVDPTIGNDEFAGDTFDQTGDTIVADPQIATMSAYAENQFRGGMTTKLNQLLKSGRCTPAEHREQSKAISVTRLSLTESGNPESTDVDTWIESRQAVPEGSFWSPDEKLKRLSAEPQPEPTKVGSGSVDIDEMTSEQVDSAVAQLTS